MSNVTIEIETCIKCPECNVQPVWGEDSWEHGEKWTCKEMGGKVIYPFVEWNDKILTIPAWCPKRVKVFVF